MYIVTSPKDIATIYKHSDTLPFDGFVKDMYISFDMSPEGLAKMFTNSTTKIHAHLDTGIRKEQLHAGTHLDDLLRIYIKHIKRQGKWENIPSGCKEQSIHGKKVVKLRKWCEGVLNLATVEAFFGTVLLELEPRLLENFHQFDANSWKLLYKYPRPFAKTMFQALDKNTEAFTRYFQLPMEKRQPCHYIRTLEAKQRKANMSDRDIGIAGYTFFWATNANHHKICFWLLAYIISDRTLVQKIREEVAPAMSDGNLDVQYLFERCPILNACLNETLRLCTNSSSARNVDVATVIGTNVLSPPAKILIPYRELHYDESYFGPDVTAFNPSRFLENKDLAKSPYFKPFGGGVSYCSGRFLAKREVSALIAVILSAYDVELENERNGIPEMDRTKPTLGVMDSIKGEDLLLNIRER